MQASDPLSQLRDIHLPDPVSYWPPALGWWVAAALLLVALIFLSRLLYRRYRRNTYRRSAMVLLNDLDRLLDSDRERSNYLININLLLKKVTTSYYRKEDLPKLTGSQWLAFLDETGDTKDFSQGPGSVLATGPYARAAEYDPAALKQCCENWLRRHR